MLPLRFIIFFASVASSCLGSPETTEKPRPNRVATFGRLAEIINESRQRNEDNSWMQIDDDPSPLVKLSEKRKRQGLGEPGVASQSNEPIKPAKRPTKRQQVQQQLDLNWPANVSSADLIKILKHIEQTPGFRPAINLEWQSNIFQLLLNYHENAKIKNHNNRIDRFLDQNYLRRQTFNKLYDRWSSLTRLINECLLWESKYRDLIASGETIPIADIIRYENDLKHLFSYKDDEILSQWQRFREFISQDHRKRRLEHAIDENIPVSILEDVDAAVGQDDQDELLSMLDFDSMFDGINEIETTSAQKDKLNLSSTKLKPKFGQHLEKFIPREHARMSLPRAPRAPRAPRPPSRLNPLITRPLSQPPFDVQLEMDNLTSQFDRNMIDAQSGDLNQDNDDHGRNHSDSHDNI